MDRLTYPDIARVFGTGLIATGVGLLMFVAITVVWGDPFTRLSAQGEQKTLARQFAATAPTNAELTDASLDPELTRRAAAIARKETKSGAAVGQIVIPRIDMRRIFVKGAETEDLMKGPGIYRETLFPGSGRAVAIAGHRTTYGAPFLNIDQIKVGDPIVLKMSYGTFTYRMTRSQIITPYDWSILDYGAAEPTAAARNQVKRSQQCVVTCEHLVLTACHPKYSAEKRIAVYARLAKVELASSSAHRGSAA